MTLAPVRAKHSVFGDLKLIIQQLRYEQLAFWRNGIGAVMTIVFSVVFLVLLSAGGSKSPLQDYGGIQQIQYYVPGFAAYGVMSACFTNLAVVLVARRELGLLKRLHLAPLPNWVMFGGIFANAFVIAATQVIILFLVGHFAYHVVLPTNILALVIALATGVLCFTSLGVAVSTLVPNQESAGPVVSIVFFVLLFLSGLWFPLTPGSGLAKFSNYFPVRHLILATFAPFDNQPGVSGWAWHDILIMGIWAVGGMYIAIRRFRWAPYRS